MLDQPRIFNNFIRMNPVRFRLHVGLAACALALLLCSCASLSSTGAGKPFVIAFDGWIGFAPFFLAQEKGYFGDLPVELRVIASLKDKHTGFESDRLQMVCETMDMLQGGRIDADYPGKIVFALDRSIGGNGIVSVAGIPSIRDLRNQDVASESGMPSHFLLQYLLSGCSLSLKDVRLLPVPTARALTAFLEGRVEAVALPQPYLSRALAGRKGAKLLGSTKDCPWLILDVAVVKKRTIRRRRNDLKIVYNAWCKAVNDITIDPEGSMDIMARAMKITPAQFKLQQEGLRYFDCEINEKIFHTTRNSSKIAFSFGLIGSVLIANGLTDAIAPAEEKIDFSIVSAGK